MDINRAKEIVSSPVMSHVTYNDAPIYIDRVNDSDSSANVHLLDDPQNRKKVPVDQLIES